MRKNQTSLVAAACESLAVALLLAAVSMNQKSACAVPLADPPQDGKTYVGRAKCASCHLKENTSWKKMKHPKAYDDLSGNYKQDKSCLACHVTGFGEPTGFKSATATPQLTGVVCEACHGPGSAHVKIGTAMEAKEKNNPAYYTKAVQSAEWKKDNELRKSSINRVKIAGVTVDAKGQVQGKNVHEAFENLKDAKGQPIMFTHEVCKKCHTSENGKKTHPDYKK